MAEFNNQNQLDSIRNLNANPTGFANKVRGFLDTHFGAANQFGTAATRNTGAATGNIPLLDAVGALLNSTFKQATTTTPGVFKKTAAQDSSSAEHVMELGSLLDITRSFISALVLNEFAGSRLDVISRSAGTPSDGITMPREAGFLICSAGAGAGVDGDPDEWGTPSPLLYTEPQTRVNDIKISPGIPTWRNIFTSSLFTRYFTHFEWRNESGAVFDDAVEFITPVKAARLGLSFGVLIHGWGTPPAPTGYFNYNFRTRYSGRTYLVQKGQPGSIFIGFKDATPENQTPIAFKILWDNIDSTDTIFTGRHGFQGQASDPFFSGKTSLMFVKIKD